MKQALAVLALAGISSFSFAENPSEATDAKKTAPVNPAAVEAVRTCPSSCGVKVSFGTDVNRPASLPRDFSAPPYAGAVVKTSAGR